MKAKNRTNNIVAISEYRVALIYAIVIIGIKRKIPLIKRYKIGGAEGR
jgi:hypothetical protein